MVRRARRRRIGCKRLAQDVDKALGFGAALLVEQFLALVDGEDDGGGRRLLAREPRHMARLPERGKDLEEAIVASRDELLDVGAAARKVLLLQLLREGRRIHDDRRGPRPDQTSPEITARSGRIVGSGSQARSSRFKRGQRPALKNDDLPLPEAPRMMSMRSTPVRASRRKSSSPRTICASRPKKIAASFSSSGESRDKAAALPQRGSSQDRGRRASGPL